MNRYKVTLKREFYTYALNEDQAKQQFKEIFNGLNPVIEVIKLRELKGKIEI